MVVSCHPWHHDINISLYVDVKVRICSELTVKNINKSIYSNHLKMQDCASRKRVITQALIERNGCSIVEINNAADEPLSPCPAGAKLESQCSVAYMYVLSFCLEQKSCVALDKGITIICVLCLALIS